MLEALTAPLTTRTMEALKMAKSVQSQNLTKRNVTQELLKALLSYDADTGVFLWKSRGNPNWDAKYAGKVAGMVNDRGRIHIGITVNGVSKKFYAHRLAFIHMTGTCPGQIDHRDGDPSNNRWGNLRPATQTQNMQNRTIHSNNSSGFKGVSWDRASGKWLAQIRINNRNKNLGRFASAQEAHTAYCSAADKHHCDFACYGARTTQPTT